MIEAVFFDIDGTLISFKTHTIPQSTLDAIDKLREKGIKIFIATGRPYALIDDNLNNIAFDGYITLNGGHCSTGKLEEIYKNSIPASDIDALVDWQQQNTPFACMFVAEDELFMNFSDSRVEEITRLLNIRSFPIKDIEYARGKKIFQLMPFIDKEDEGELMRNVFPNCDVTRWNPLFADVIARGNSKQVGIDKVLEYYGIDLANTISFGDGGNDVPMLRHTPISVAMGNAADDVKKHATHVTDSVDDDGV